jgi:hypothetical protein
MIYIIDEFVLFLLNPFGMLVAMGSLLYIEKMIFKSIKSDIRYNGVVQLKIKQIA